MKNEWLRILCRGKLINWFPILWLVLAFIILEIWPIQHSYTVFFIFYPTCVVYTFLFVHQHFLKKRNWLFVVCPIMIFSAFGRIGMSSGFRIYPLNNTEIVASIIPMIIVIFLIGLYLKRKKRSTIGIAAVSVIVSLIMFLSPFFLRGEPFLSKMVLAESIIRPDVIETSQSGKSVFIANDLDLCQVISIDRGEKRVSTFECSTGWILGAVCKENIAYIAKRTKLFETNTHIITFDSIKFDGTRITKKLELPDIDVPKGFSTHLSGDAQIIAMGVGKYIFTEDMSFRNIGTSQNQEFKFLGWENDNETAVFLDDDTGIVLFERPLDESRTIVRDFGFDHSDALYIYREEAQELVVVAGGAKGEQAQVTVYSLRGDRSPRSWNIHSAFTPSDWGKPIDMKGERVSFLSNVFQPLVLDLESGNVSLAVPPAGDVWAVGYSRESEQIFYAKRKGLRGPYFLYKN